MSISSVLVGFRLTAAAASVLFVGCVGSMPRETYLKKTLVPRASFDLQCPEADIVVRDLGPPTEAVRFGDTSSVLVKMSETQGVTGCGKRGTYVLVEGSKWVMNTEQQKEQKPTEGK